MTRFLPFRLDRCRYALLFGLILGAGIVATPSPAAAVEWHHEKCSDLVNVLTEYKDETIEYYTHTERWMRFQVRRMHHFADRCGVTCHDVGDWWLAWAKKNQKKVRLIRESSKEFTDAFQGWIDFMDKCLKSVEKGNAGDSAQRQALVNGFTLLNNKIRDHDRERADYIQKEIVEWEFSYAKNC